VRLPVISVLAGLFCAVHRITSMETKTRKKAVKKAAAKKAPAKKKDIAASYNEVKDFGGQPYTGMKVGRSHKWYYDKGEWREKKITPDLWEISYAVTKRRAGKAPEGSGVPVGTEYHWYILSHQVVKKLNANDYSTAMSGVKYKLAHKRADKEKWSATARTQRKRLVKLMQEMIAQLEMEPIPLEIEYKGKEYVGEGIPIPKTCDEDGPCYELEITLNNEYIGILHYSKSGWKMDQVKDKGLIKAIGEEVYLWYE
ncbi:MAG: hypothetical protein K0R82_1504, partial [Flavipsychrobacter sp.]|nr:hypothetical protein [Flavipsychrobacter sp.]